MHIESLQWAVLIQEIPGCLELLEEFQKIKKLCKYPFQLFRMPDRIIEVGNAGAGIPGCLGMLEEPFEKEDMSGMFRTAFLEALENVDEPDLPRWTCFVCGKIIIGRCMTAMSHKFHPECFVCAYY